MDRTSYVTRTFGGTVPRLWCPLLTHFASPAQPDRARVHQLMRHIAPSVKGLLIPGSTGEGWDMTDDDIRGLLEIVLGESKRLGQHVLIGALKPDAAGTIDSMRASLDLVRELSGKDDPFEALGLLGIAGFTICPPTGADLSQETIASEVAKVLDLGLPTALYQLPQVTGNEIEPESVAELARRYGNLFLFKDTSGADRVANAAEEYAGIFLVRGAEGAYSSWPKDGGGRYDGFLLSTANTFSRELGTILALLGSGEKAEADALSGRITRVVETLFPPAGEVPAGNAFANANKAIDHVRAWGAHAFEKPMPMLYGGTRLPKSLVAHAREVLEREGFSVEPGYLE